MGIVFLPGSGVIGLCRACAMVSGRTLSALPGDSDTTAGGKTIFMDYDLSGQKYIQAFEFV